MNGTVILTDVSFSSNTVTAGTGAYNGSAAAADVFICTDQDALCGAVVNACGTTSTSEIVGAFGSSCPGAAAPEIDITGNGVSIADNDITPDFTDHTDFGSISAGSSVTRTYTIANTGDADLNLNGSGEFVVLDGAGCTEFTVTAQPTSPVSSGGTTTFTVQYSPTDAGEDICTVMVDNNDSDENLYDFSITGTGSRSNGWLSAIYMLLR
ncbi:MAG: choice-of-anchor D domain-containing protein [Candidatus Electrothrix sp. AU1_5]|nr:choice-of-anchor D domain-containing protein [Candidatus Electrothrix gigas]